MKIIAIAAVKGGVGKTTTAVNLAAALAKQCKQRVLLVDTNMHAPNVGLHIGVSNLENGFEKVLQNRCSITEAVYPHAYGFDVLLPNVQSATKITRLKEKLQKLDYDYMVLDTTPTFAKEHKAALQAADEVLLVTTQDIPTLSVTQKSIKYLQEIKKPLMGIICNRIQKNALSPIDIEEMLAVPVIASIKESHHIAQSLAQTKSVVQNAPYSNAAQSYIACAKEISGQPLTQASRYKLWKQRVQEYIGQKKTYNQTHNF